MLFRRKTTSHSSLGKPWGTSKALSNEIQLLLTSSRHSGKNEHRSINHILVTIFSSKGTSISFKKEQKLLSSQGTSTSTLCFPSPSSTRSSSWWELMSKMKFSLSTCLRFYNCSIAAGNMVAYKVILSNILPVCLWNEQMSKLSDLEPKKLIVFF